MAEDLLQTLTRFHREVMVPELERTIGEFRDEVRSRFDDVNGHFDAVYGRFDRLEDEFQSLGATVDRLEQRVVAL